MKLKIRNEYIRRINLICKSNINAGNFISGMNACVIGVMRYIGGIIDWTSVDGLESEKDNDIEQMFAPKK